MKALIVFSAFFLILFLASCSSSRQAAVPYDEVYATTQPKSGTSVNYDRANVQSDPVGETSSYKEGEYSDDYVNEDFDPEGYYDYEYSSRIKRFHETSPGFDYYDNYYTNSSNYDNSTYGYGNSIYSGYGCSSGYGGCFGRCSGLSLSLGFGMGWGSFGYGWGYPYYRWGYPYYRWGYPYYGWGYPYYGWDYYPGYYYGSYWNGYWDGYYAGGGGYYYNPYDYGSSYYGPRTNRGGSSDGTGGLSKVPRDGS